MNKKGDNMIKSRFKWQLLNNNEVNNEESLFDILLNNRNINSEKEKSLFFSDEIHYYDPFLFRDMEKVVLRIKEAIDKQEKIMLYGDFDVDGVTGVAILYKAIKKLNGNVFYYIPSRFNEGYGPNLECFKRFVDNDFKLIITVDNGITGISEAEYLKSVNVDLIITDHHEPLEDIPNAYAIIHPNIKRENYPFKYLSGCGVALKLAHGLLGEIPFELIDLAALGTVTDLVSLTDENRSIVKIGLKQIPYTIHLGLRLLMQKVNLKVIDEYSFGFIFGPRLNAPGRMDNGNVAVRLLITEDYQEARNLVEDIESLNNDRKAKIDSIIEESIEIITKDKLDNFNVIVVSKEDWHEGVLGIVCNRLVDIYHKPVIVLTESKGEYKGSARTLDDFPLHENLKQCSDLLIKFGGHKMACGLTIDSSNIDLLRKRLHELADTNLNNYLKIDTLISENLINITVSENIQKFRPFGQNNQNPLFLIKDCEVMSIMGVGDKKKHLKLSLRKNNHYFDAIAFNLGYLFYNINNHDYLDIVGTLEVNDFNQNKVVQIRVDDIKCLHKQVFDYRNKPFSEDNFDGKEFQYIYFQENYTYDKAEKFHDNIILNKDVVVIDIPTKESDFTALLRNQNWENLYLLLKCDEFFSHEHLLTREKLGKIYQTYRKLGRFNRYDSKISLMLEKMGINKSIQKLSLQVFFELDFVIIEGNEIIFVEKPQKRSLTDSETYKSIKEQVILREKLILSSSDELLKLINKYIHMEVI